MRPSGSSKALLALVFSTSLLACGGGGGGGTASGFTIRGTITAGAGLRAGPAAAVLPSDVKTVLAFSTGDEWWSAPVAADGTFSLQLDPSRPVGLVFAGADGQLLAYLALSSGLSSLPLQAVAADVQTLDLGTLLLGATTVEPATDPAALLAGLSETDLAALLQAGGVFGDMVKNPDVDGDGAIDLLQGHSYRPFLIYFVDGGAFGDALTPTVSAGLYLNSYRFCFQANDTSAYPDTVYFTWPDGSATGVPNDQAPNKGSGYATYGSAAITDGSVPPEGDYTVLFGDAGPELTFHVPDQGEAISRVVLAVPTVRLDGAGKLIGFDWRYQLGGLSDGAAEVEPASLIDSVMVQVNADTAVAETYRCAASGVTESQASGGRVWDTSNLPADALSVDVEASCRNIPWSVVDNVSMAYNDVYGNHIVVTWRRQVRR